MEGERQRFLPRAIFSESRSLLGQVACAGKFQLRPVWHCPSLSGGSGRVCRISRLERLTASLLRERSFCTAMAERKGDANIRNPKHFHKYLCPKRKKQPLTISRARVAAPIWRKSSLR